MNSDCGAGLVCMTPGAATGTCGKDIFVTTLETLYYIKKDLHIILYSIKLFSCRKKLSPKCIFLQDIVQWALIAKQVKFALILNQVACVVCKF